MFYATMLLGVACWAFIIDIVSEEDSDDANETIGTDGGDSILTGGKEDFVQAGDGNDLIAGGSDDDDLRGEGGEDLIFGESDDDLIFGGGGGDALFGGGGEDRIEGGEEADILQGDDGDDTLVGNLGDDVLFGVNLLDTAEIKESAEADGWTGLADLEAALADIPNELDAEDTSGVDVLEGRQGDDTLYVGSGDSADGGAGTDTYVFGSWNTGDAAQIIAANGSDEIVLDWPEDEDAPEVAVEDIDAETQNLLVNGAIVASISHGGFPFAAEDILLEIAA